jgi:hypothetical protein
MKEHVRLNGTLDAPRVPNIERMSIAEIAGAFRDGLRPSMESLIDQFSDRSLATQFEEKSRRHAESLASEAWKSLFPGKQIFRRFCALLGAEQDRIRRAYLDIAIAERPQVFQEVGDILLAFRDQ